MQSSETGWWRRHGWTVALLLTAVGISFAIRSIFMAPLIAQYGALYVYGGGSDSYYHSRVMSYIILNHHNLVLDTALRYPTGAINPREPLFDWMNATLGILFAPFFGGDAVNAGAFFLTLQGPLWAALGVFPVYWIGKEVFSKRTGLIGAIMFPFVVGSINASTLGYANYLSFYTFFILLTLYGYIRTIKVVGSRRWVASYRQPKQFVPALRQFLLVERTAVKWAVFTGVCFGALALAWQGYSYAVAVLAVFIVFAMVVERIRRVDSFGVYVVTWIVGLVGFPIAVPYYLFQGEFAGWFDLPLLVFFGVLALLLPFLLLRDVPWVFSIPALVAIVLGGAAALNLLSPAFFTNIVTGQGYFVKTVVYSTVAEAQAPSIDQLIIGYGVVTFFLAFVGVALTVLNLIQNRFQRWVMLFLVFAVVSIYLPLTAAKFFLIASPAFALLPAEALSRALDVGGYPELRRTVASLSDRRSQFAAFRKAFKARHVLIMILVIGIILPNVWYSIDAGIPYNSKTAYSQQIYNSFPASIQSSQAGSGDYYLGAAGTQLDTPALYDSNGYNWLAQQDQNTPPPNRPAFISWWDYGFQAVDQGQHPTVADNFQNGIAASGNFLLSQNESQAIGILATQLLSAELLSTAQTHLPPTLAAQLTQDGINVPMLEHLLVDQSADVTLVIAHPEIYLPVDPSTLTPLSAMFIATSYFLAQSLPTNGVAQVYNEIQSYTGWTIRYAMVDNRLFPFNPQNTGIFYAPATLTGRVIGSGGVPTTYFTVSVTGSNGLVYPSGQLPPGVTAVNSTLNWLTPFYQSMIFKTFIGYNGTQIGQGAGIPGLTQNLANSPIEPGWMLQHFQVVYRTSYYCSSQAEAQSNPNCYVAMNIPAAKALQARSGGLVDLSPQSYFSGGTSFLQYYPGQPLVGAVTLPDGTPVQNVRLTVYDSFGIPHMTTTTSSDGSYSVILPPGNDRVNVTAGPINGLAQAGTTALSSISVTVPAALGFSLNAPTLVRSVVLKPAAVQGFVYWNNANNASYVPSKDTLVTSATIQLWGQGPRQYTTQTDSSGSFLFSNVAPGVYNFNVHVQGGNLTGNQAFAGAGAIVNRTTGLNPGVLVGTVRTSGGSAVLGATVTAGSRSGYTFTVGSNASGGYRISDLVPGNYTLTATLPSSGFQTTGTPVSIAVEGSQVRTNLTLVPVNPLELTVIANGNPVVGLPVRFSFIPSFSNSSRSAIAVAQQASANTSVYVTNGAGSIFAQAPVGNYSIYASGYVNGILYSGFTTGYVGPGNSPPVLPPLFLQPAVILRGTVPNAGSVGSVSPQTVLTVYDSRGDQVSVWADANGSFAVPLPASTYSVLALQGTTSPSAPLYSELQSVDLVSSQSLSFSLAATISARFAVGAELTTVPGGLFPADGAEVSVSIGPSGANVTTLSDENGRVNFYLPATLPFGPSYCVSLRAAGFTFTQQCQLSPNALALLTQFAAPLHSVPVTYAIYGVPSGTTVTVNLTALSPSAQNVTATGIPPFQFSAFPGTYRVSAWAPSLAPPGIYLPGSIANITIPLGAQQDSLTILLLHQVPSSGSLILPPSVSATAVRIQLTSPIANVSVNGSEFQTKFFAAPGVYAAAATAMANGIRYSNLSQVSISANGVLSAPINLLSQGAQVQGNLTQPSGSVLDANVPITFVGAGNIIAYAQATNGAFSTSLPVNASYSVELNATVLITENGISSLQTFVPAPGTVCNVPSVIVTCNIPLVATVLLANLNGTVSLPGYPGGLSGSILLVGPSPSYTRVSVPVISGSFSVQVLPGTYTAYTTAGGPSAPFASLNTLTVNAEATLPVSIVVRSTWVNTLTVVAPVGAVGGATIRIGDSSGITLVLPNEPFGTALPFALPTGTYSVTANATGFPFGVTAQASASATVNLLYGNAATWLSPTFQFPPSVTVRLVAPLSVTVAAGNSATFAFSVTNTGNGPVTFHMTGAPAFWPFAFSFGIVTLGVAAGNNSLAGEVTIHVPLGTAVNHPPVSFHATLLNGTVIGTTNPGPTISVLPYFGLVIGANPSQPTSVAPFNVSIPFFLRNTGNLPVSVDLTVSDAIRLASLGWTTTFSNAQGRVSNPVSLAPGANNTYSVSLVAPNPIAPLPGSISVLAYVLEAGGSLSATVTLKVPILVVNPAHGPTTVTGPSVGAEPTYPDWFVPVLSFVPVIALVIGVVSYRRYRSRRWVRR